jgi:shikimate dehydrogenase
MYAEVIGDPIGHSKSPLIHRHWLHRIGLGADFCATHVPPERLPAFLAGRRADPVWRGCNVTIPHKVEVIPLLDQVDDGAAQIGAVNCIIPGPHGLTGRNTDLDGIAAALAGTTIDGRKVALIGAGGAARAALRYFVDQGAASIHLIVRDPEKAKAPRDAFGNVVELHHVDRPDAALNDAAVIVNASPLGMSGAPPMPPALLTAIASHASDATVMDMVYKPIETEFLAIARAHGGRCVDGLQMLIGQARAAFEMFFGDPAPPGDDELRNLLVTPSPSHKA